jgi:hypothetical protein
MCTPVSVLRQGFAAANSPPHRLSWKEWENRNIQRFPSSLLLFLREGGLGDEFVFGRCRQILNWRPKPPQGVTQPTLVPLKHSPAAQVPHVSGKSPTPVQQRLVETVPPHAMHAYSGVSVGTQPLSALFTPITISSTRICPSLLASPARQSVNGTLPSAMFTKVRISSTVTVLSSLQSPSHGLGVGVGVAVPVAVGVPVLVLVAVLVGVGVPVGVLLGVGVGVAVSVFVGVFVAVLVGVSVGVLVGV